MVGGTCIKKAFEAVGESEKDQKKKKREGTDVEWGSEGFGGRVSGGAITKSVGTDFASHRL